MEREELRVESPLDLDLTTRACGQNADQRLTKIARMQRAGKARNQNPQRGDYGGHAYQPPANDRVFHGRTNAQIRAPRVGMHLPSGRARLPITATAPRARRVGSYTLR